MNNMNLKGLAIFLVAFSFLGEVYAVNCDKNPGHQACGSAEVAATAFAGEVHTFRTDRVNEKFIVTGTGMNAVTTVTLGNSLASITHVDDNTLEIPFNLSTAFLVAGNVEFSLDGDLISLVYLDGPIVAPSGNCPCQADWLTYLGTSTGSCTEVTDGTQVSLSSYVDTGSGIYFISTAFDPGPGNATNSFCATVEVDGSLVAVPGGIYEQNQIGSSDHANCYSYMAANHCIAPIVVYP